MDTIFCYLRNYRIVVSDSVVSVTFLFFLFFSFSDDLKPDGFAINWL